MRPYAFTIVAGGSPALEQLAALAAALSALLDGERREVSGSAPPTYGSRWRRAGIAEATAPFVQGRGT